jgi:hypothetical protein
MGFLAFGCTKAVLAPDPRAHAQDYFDKMAGKGLSRSLIAERS